ncbi:unnamed protein product [Caenorhabditis auriculariae]|uniref:ELP1 first N-terminal beta-propeller domain-containing protein n=1 Tax=Caenorhabditis auriculariae TaxID=2777116 RepID=A0A8S1GMS8_9PELO|nr:unnamed protein product [Caenorhabditis auriculariae]
MYIATESHLVIVPEDKTAIEQIDWKEHRSDVSILCMNIYDRAIVAVRSDGDYVTCDLDSKLVGFMEGNELHGSTDAKWSHDESVLCLADESFYWFVGSDYVYISTGDIDVDRLVMPVNVGWGSAETQFRGSEGKKKAADSEAPEKELSRSSATRVEWRWDDAFVAVSYMDRHRGRSIIIFDNEGEPLHRMNPSKSPLGHVFAIRPNANIICSTTILDGE